MLTFLSPATKRYAFRVASLLNTSTILECFSTLFMQLSAQIFLFSLHVSSSSSDSSQDYSHVWIRCTGLLNTSKMKLSASCPIHTTWGAPGFYFRVCCPSDVGKLTSSSRIFPPRHLDSSSGTCHARVTLPTALCCRHSPSFSEAVYTYSPPGLLTCMYDQKRFELIQGHN